MRFLKTVLKVCLVVVLGGYLVGCSAPAQTETQEKTGENIQATGEQTNTVTIGDAPSEPETDTSSSTDIQTENSNTLSYSAFNAEEYPNYVKIYDMPCTVDVELEPGEIQFSELDELGRSGRAVGKITIDLINESAGWRTEFASNSDPSGWGHNGEVTIPFADGNDYHGWLYNRSHLIADSLGGYTHVYNSDGSINEDESTTPKTDLITGTRTQNVGENNGDGGMQYFESTVVEYLKANPDDAVWYSARPVYEGDELVPRSVIVSAKADSGNYEVVGEVFNCAEGIEIDYSNGTWSAV